ncbi:MFS transporter [Microbacterium halotolerans]|uniref:MFS transporter n=1 Tax=Microbacterium halotolerans TaxID=246613 RepID=UPI0019698245|nr:MFS transporter [Microbacterium halotolerans]
MHHPDIRICTTPLTGDRAREKIMQVKRSLPMSLLGANLLLNLLYAALGGVIVPALLENADPVNKDVHLAIVMTASSAMTIAIRPLVGAWSDRTKGRFGRRTPWIVAGAIASAVAVVWLGQADTVIAVAFGWLIAQPLLNVIESPLDAVLADRVPEPARARTAAYYGAGAALGLAVGAVAAGATIDDLGLTTLGAALLLVAGMISFVLLNPDRTVTDPRPRRRPGEWRALWRSRGFSRVFIGRVLVVLGQQMVLVYLLYIVIDRTDQNAADAGRTLAAVVGVHIACLVVGALAATRAARRNRVATVMVATVIGALGLGLPILIPGIAGLIAYAVVSGLGRGAYVTSDLLLLLHVLPSEESHGRDLGYFGWATLLPQAVAPALAGVLLTLTAGSYSILFAVAVVLALCSLPVVAALAERTRA